MGKIDDYRQTLRELQDWDAFLLEHSNLPGPRANLELARAVAMEGDEILFRSYLALDSDEAPTGSKEEFLAFCGTLGVGYLIAGGRIDLLPISRQAASDPRWRIREGVALGLQEWGRHDMDALLRELAAWVSGSFFEQRAVVAGLCEPSLIADKHHAAAVLHVLDRITDGISRAAENKSEGFRALRKTLGYGWSVVVAGQPEIGMSRMEAWIRSNHPDVRWVMKNNLRKNRLARVDQTWVDEQLTRLSQ